MQSCYGGCHERLQRSLTETKCLASAALHYNPCPGVLFEWRELEGELGVCYSNNEFDWSSHVTWFNCDVGASLVGLCNCTILHRHFRQRRNDPDVSHHETAPMIPSNKRWLLT